MTWKSILLFALMAAAVLLVGAVAGERAGVQAADAPVPIVSSSPWTEASGTIVNGEAVQFSFSGEAGQIASIDAYMPVTLTMKGEVRLLQASTGSTFNDALYGTSRVWYNQQSHWDEVGIAAALPETGEYLIEIAPNSAYTASFSLRFNLVDPAAAIEVDDDLVQCPAAPTGIVRGAVRAIAAGGTVSVCEGTYLETTRMILSQPNVTIHGAGADLTRVSGDDYNTFQIGTINEAVDASNATIRDLTLDSRQRGQPAVQLYRNSHGLTVRDCVIDTANAVPQGIQSSTWGAPHNDVTVQDCRFVMARTGTGSAAAIVLLSDRARILRNSMNNEPGIYAERAIEVRGTDAIVRDNVVGQEDSPGATIFNGVRVIGDRGVIEDNEIYSYGEGIFVATGDTPPASRAEWFVIRGNLLGANTTANGGVSDGILARQVLDLTLENNFIRGYPNLSRGIRLDRVGGRVVNNRIQIRYRDGIYLSWNASSLDPHPVHPLTVANNTFRDAEYGYYGTGLILTHPDTITASLPYTIVNNIFAAPVPDSDSPVHCGLRSTLPLPLADHNLYYGYWNSYCDAATAGGHDVYGDPEFADAEMRLLPTSPAIDAGTPVDAPDLDFEGEGRPLNLGWDIGADERLAPADLAVSKTGPAAFYAGWEIDYEVAVTNLGPAVATDVELIDDYDSLFELVSLTAAVGSCTDGRPASCDLGTLAPGETVTVAVVLSTTHTGTVFNRAWARSAVRDEDVSNNRAEVLTKVEAGPSGPFDIIPLALEVSQAIQNLDNEVPLVEGKTTVARLYLGSDGETVPNISAVLHGRRGGVPLPGSPLAPMTDYVTVDVDGAGPDRTALTDTIQFLLPDSWTSGAVVLEGEANLDLAELETDPTNNRILAAVEFWDLPDICIRTYPVLTVQDPDFGHNELSLAWDYLLRDPDGMIPRALSLLPTQEIRIYPVDKLLERLAKLPWPHRVAYDMDKQEIGLLIRLWKIDQLSNDPNECDRSKARTHYMGLVHPESKWDRGGYADGIIANDQLLVAFSRGGDEGFEQPFGGTTLAHELGHNYGRFHVPCGPISSAEPRDNKYPYHPCMIAPDRSPDGFYGLDLADPTSLEAIPPRAGATSVGASLGDLMTYAGDTWISDYNWKRIGWRLCKKRYDKEFCADWDYFAAAADAAGAAAQGVGSTAEVTYTFPYSGDILLVSGWMTETVGLSGVERLAEGLMPQGKVDELWNQQMELTAGGAPYELRLLDAEGGLLYTQTFTAGAIFEGDGDDFFGMVAPWVEGTGEVQVVMEGSVAISQTASPHAPTVTLLAPEGGEAVTDTLAMSWEAEDLDGDELSYLVQYSADNGATWQVVDMEVYTTSTSLDTSLLPGSDGQSLVRVIASDGLLTGSDQSAAPFSLAGHAPLTLIQNPEEGRTFMAGEAIHLQGQAYDPEEGHLEGAALVWTLAGAGEVGTGREATIFGLEPGEYEVTLRATDGDGQSSAQTVRFEVVPELASSFAVYLPLVVR